MADETMKTGTKRSDKLSDDAARRRQQADRALKVIAELREVLDTGGRRLTRDERSS